MIKFLAVRGVGIIWKRRVRAAVENKGIDKNSFSSAVMAALVKNLFRYISIEYALKEHDYTICSLWIANEKLPGIKRIRVI